MTMPQTAPCDLCESEPSVMSLMNLADHSQVLVGANCMPAFLRGLLGSIEGQAEGDDDTHDTPPPDGSPPAAGPPEAAPGPPEGDPGPAPPAARTRARAAR